MWVVLTATDCEDWAFLQYVGVRTSPFLKLRNQNKNKKSHNFVIGIYIFSPRLFRFFFSPRYLSRLKRYNVDLLSRVFGFVRRSARLNCSTWVASISWVIRREKKVENRNAQNGMKLSNRTTDDTSITKKLKLKKFFVWSFLSFFRGLFCFRHNSNI